VVNAAGCGAQLKATFCLARARHAWVGHHIGDLDPFTLGVTQLLDSNGIFVIEVPHALELVELNEFDGVYHEHVSQLTVKSFVDHLSRFGLEVFDVEPLDVHGGSIRVFARAARNGSAPPAQAWSRPRSRKRPKPTSSASRLSSAAACRR